MSWFRTNSKLGGGISLGLSMIFFVLCIAGYMTIAHVRHVENPQDKITPTVSQIADAFYRAAFVPDRKGDYRLLEDTWASVRRFSISLIILFGAVLIGVNMRLPFFEKMMLRPLTFFDKVPALAVLPILMIAVGLGEVSKVTLIVIGVFPTIALDTYLNAKSVPEEQVTKGKALAASEFEIIYRIILPQIFPKALNTIRLNFKAMLLFLIAGEALAAQVGLGYRIYVVQRYFAMDTIIAYVCWMSLLAFFADMSVRFYIKKRYPWFGK